MNYVLERPPADRAERQEGDRARHGRQPYFDSGQPHGMKALDGKTVRFLATNHRKHMVERFPRAGTSFSSPGEITGRTSHPGSGEFPISVTTWWTRRRAARQERCCGPTTRAPKSSSPLPTSSAKATARPRISRASASERGDVVMLILKRRYEFWFSILALHKLGAVAIPATHLLAEGGCRLPLQHGRDQGHRRGGRTGDHRPHRGGHARKPDRTADQRVASPPKGFSFPPASRRLAFVRPGG